MNYYESTDEKVIKLKKEVLSNRSNFNMNSVKDDLIKAWFKIIESTGGGAQANPESDKFEERILSMIERSLKEFEADTLINNMMSDLEDYEQINVEEILKAEDYSICDAETIRSIILYGLNKSGANELYIKINPIYNFHKLQ